MNSIKDKKNSLANMNHLKHMLYKRIKTDGAYSGGTVIFFLILDAT